MNAPAPHFVLFSEAISTSDPPSSSVPPAATGTSRYWHFLLRTDDGSVKLDICDEESGASDERLALLAVVRGLEAIPQPARVTLVTASSSIRRALRFGLDNWRDNQWQWERFGQMTPIKNVDLWQRVDRALAFHELECRSLSSDLPTDDLNVPLPRARFVEDPPPEVRPRAKAAKSRMSPRGPSIDQTARPCLMGMLRRLFGWCGLCRSQPSLVIAAH
ncbi:MAG: ribonuclease H family protein [Pirellulaceae bacterium]